MTYLGSGGVTCSSLFLWPALQIGFQISVVILVGTQHDELEGITYEPIGQKVLNGLDFEFVDINSAKITFLWLSDGRVIQDIPNLMIQY